MQTLSAQMTIYKSIYEGLRVPIAVAVSFKYFCSEDAEIVLRFTDSRDEDGEVIELKINSDSDSPSISLQ